MEIIERETLRDILEKDCRGYNFILEADRQRATEIGTGGVFYSKAENLFIARFNEPLKEILENKLKEYHERRCTTQNITNSQNV